MAVSYVQGEPFATGPEKPGENPRPHVGVDVAAGESATRVVVLDGDAIVHEGAWTAADEAAFADEPLHLSGPARYAVVPCGSCERGGELPCDECGAVERDEVGR